MNWPGIQLPNLCVRSFILSPGNSKLILMLCRVVLLLFQTHLDRTISSSLNRSPGIFELLVPVGSNGGELITESLTSSNISSFIAENEWLIDT